MKNQSKPKNSKTDSIGFGDGALSEMRREGFTRVAREIESNANCRFLWRRAAEEVLLALAKASARIPILYVATWDGWSNSDALPDDDKDKENFGNGKFTIAVEVFKEDADELQGALFSIMHGVGIVGIENDGGSFSATFRAYNATDDDFSDFTKFEHEEDKRHRSVHWQNHGIA